MGFKPLPRENQRTVGGRERRRERWSHKEDREERERKKETVSKGKGS